MRQMNLESTKSDVHLTSGLRAMAAAAPAEAPRELGDALTKAFRRHHARRRALRRSTFALVVLAVIFLAGRILVQKPVPPVSSKSLNVNPVDVQPPTGQVPARPSAATATDKGRHIKPRRRSKPSPRDFVVLASFDQTVRDEDLQVVRLELTGRALRLAGAPVTEEMADRRLLADFVVGQDGTPYAVRLVPRKHVLE
jgi:hypothetical protein